MDGMISANERSRSLSTDMLCPIQYASSLRYSRTNNRKRMGRRSYITKAGTKVAVFVEPSPFSHISGMKIRFLNLIKGLREIGDEVTVVTPCISPPQQYHGAKVTLSPLSLLLN